ncbi:MAG: hypothetical protein QOI73_1444 [Solirubrobacteraceae bacterium]|nr:hypothetical protein [Solirubrobacteraceae bacterium]
MSRPLPRRYHRHPAVLFGDAVGTHLRSGSAILDVGSGRRPALAPEDRPGDSRYVGLDLSATELELAPLGSYDEHVVADISEPVEALLDGFDLVISWQVLEHVRDVAGALEHMRGYLRPGGHLVAFLSARNSIYGRLNTLLPAQTGVWLMRVLLRRNPDSVFPAYYDHCTSGELRTLMAPWTAAEIRPVFLGASYFNFSHALRDVYVAYENWAARTGRADLATHYLIVGRR